MFHALPSERCHLSAPSCPDTSGAAHSLGGHTGHRCHPTAKALCPQEGTMRCPMASSARERPGAAARGMQAPPSPEAMLQVVCSGLVSCPLAKCHEILRKEPGVSSRQPGDRFPVRLATSFPIQAPFFPPPGSERDASPLQRGRWGAAGAAAASLPGLPHPPSPLGCPLQGQSPPALVRLIPPPARGGDK